MSAAVRIISIARYTFLEAVRDRVFYNLIVFAVLVGGSALVMGQISIGIERVLLVNLGLTALSLIGVILAVFLSIGMVSKEIERRTLYTVLTRPVQRWEFLVGKFCGLAATLSANTLLMAAGFSATLVWQTRSLAASAGLPAASAMVSPDLLAAIYFLFLQMVIVVAVGIFFSAMSSPLLAAVFTTAIFLIGNFTGDLRVAAKVATGVAHWAGMAATWVLPDLSSLNVIAAVAHGQGIAAQLIWLNTLYAALYCGAVLGGAALIFQQRELQ